MTMAKRAETDWVAIISFMESIPDRDDVISFFEQRLLEEMHLMRIIARTEI